MPGKLKVKVVAGRDLPVMDRVSELTDAFVEVKFGSTTYKTDVYRKSLYPQWNSDWFRFEVDDEDLQDEPLQLRVLDHDTYSAHDAIGKVYIDLNPLLAKERNVVISGWFPIYDTMHGIRGELNVIVKIDLFSDFNKFRQSSCGVQFFSTSGIPNGYRIQAIHGFVEELVVNDDPEYQWIDKIRSMRASNEARQIQFSKLSGELQRKIGRKVLEIAGNAVIGYRQCFDLEGESGIVVRGIGTSVTMNKRSNHSASPPHSSSPIRDPFQMGAQPSPSPNAHLSSKGGLPRLASSPGFLFLGSAQGRIYPGSGRAPTRRGSLPSNPPSRSPNVGSSFPLPEEGMAPSSPVDSIPIKISTSPTKVGFGPSIRRSSDSDIGTPPKACGSLAGSSGSGGGSGSGTKAPFHRPVLLQESIEMLEYPFFTITTFPSGFLVHLGGVVSARSVKLLDRIHNPDEPETRDVWWTELRTEIRSHARAMGCHAVIGYEEQTTICDEVIVLSASGTAALVNLGLTSNPASIQQSMLTMSQDRAAFDLSKEKIQADKRLHVDVNLANQAAAHRIQQLYDSNEEVITQCYVCHVPYAESSLPFPVHLSKCAVCRQHKVPDVLFTTIEPPLEMPVVGKGCLIQARICRTKKELKGEHNAKDVSDCLPFMEYELHNQLINKLKVKGMNSLFGLRIQFAVGDKLIVAVATATAVFAAPLPAIPLPKILCKEESKSIENANLQEMQHKILDSVNKNRDAHCLYIPEYLTESVQRASLADDSEDETSADAELSAGNKDTFILEVDDAEDVAVVSVLLDPPIPRGFEVCNTERMPGVPNVVSNLQMFTKVWSGQLNVANNKSFSTIFDHILRGLFFKLRSFTPCAITHLTFDIDIPDDDVIQVCITGLCAGIGEPATIANSLMDIAPVKQEVKKVDQQEDMQFHMEMSSDGPLSQPQSQPVHQTPPPSQGHLGTPHVSAPKTTSTTTIERRVRYHSGPKKCPGVEITPLSYVPGGRVESYLGHLNFFIIRETTSVRGEGGLNGFMHSFLAEVMAICRAHVAALGGNALIAYTMSECELEDNLHKNQSQCCLNVCGDVVHVLYGLELQTLLTPGGSMSSACTKGSSASPAAPDRRSKGDPSPINSPQVQHTIPVT